MGNNPPYRPICEGVDEITVSNITDESGWIKIYGKNADALILGDATHEGGDIKVYRDGSNNLQFSLDADAASNALALSVYGGVVAQNYLTVGQAGLNTTYPFYANGNSYIGGNQYVVGDFYFQSTNKKIYGNPDSSAVSIDIFVADSTAHSINLQIDANNIIEVKATGDGSGGITNKAIGLYGGTPATQHAAIADATDAATAISQLNLLLAANRAISLIAT